MSPVEIIKHRPEEFGGIQTTLLDEAEKAARYCAAKNCGGAGWVQQILPGSNEDVQTFRVICKLHYVLVAMLMSAGLGDDSPLQEARTAAEEVGLDWAEFMAARPIPSPVRPEEFLCLSCGGKMMSETVGMFSGRRWIHTCGESVRG